MDEKYLKCTWQEFEEVIRRLIRSDLKWCIKPEDTPMNRKMVVNLIREDIGLNHGEFPEKMHLQRKLLIPYKDYNFNQYGTKIIGPDQGVIA